MQKKILKYPAILLLSLMLSMTFLTASMAEAKVEAKDNKIVMDVQDAIDIYRYIAQLEAENKVLKEGLNREREATNQYTEQTSKLLQQYESERIAWMELEQQMNKELQNQRIKTYKTLTTALILGGLIGAVISD